MVNRSEWGAIDYNNYTRTKLEKPEYVIISQTDYGYDHCFNKLDCIKRVRQKQRVQSETYDDIKYNFLIGGDGNIYEGRGWEIAGEHTSWRYNNFSLGITFLGNFNFVNATRGQMIAAKKLVDYSFKNNKVAKDYKLTGLGQIDGTINPGRTILKIIREWPRWTENP